MFFFATDSGMNNAVRNEKGRTIVMAIKRKADDIDRDECFDVICFYSGQGDCTMIRCPDGNIIMIDCGSTGGLDNTYKDIIRKQVRDPKWAGSNQRINALILTHSDADHYNQVLSLLPADKASTYKRVLIDNIYVSNAAKDDSPLGKYRGIGANLEYFSTQNVYEVTINTPNTRISPPKSTISNFVKTWNKKTWVTDDGEKPPKEKRVPVTTKITGDEYSIFSGKTSKDVEWDVSIIAGNVDKIAGIIKGIGAKPTDEYKDGSTATNAKSLVTRLQIGGSKILFCGDATFSTEAFLLDTKSSLITNAILSAAPHHGSEEASCAKFVTTVNANTVVISTELMEHRHRHPRKVALDRWRSVVKIDDPHMLDYWDTDLKAESKALANWKTNSVPVNVDAEKKRSFTSLQTIPSIPPTAIYGVSTGGELYREQVTQKIRSTALSITPNTPSALNQFVHCWVSNSGVEFV